MAKEISYGLKSVDGRKVSNGHKSSIEKKEILDLLANGQMSREELNVHFGADKDEHNSRYQALSKVLGALERDGAIASDPDEEDGRKLNYRLYNYDVHEKGPSSEVDRLILEQIKVLVADILASDAFVLSEFQNNVADPIMRRLTDLGTFDPNGRLDEIVRDLAKEPDAPGQKVIEARRDGAGKLRTAMTGEWSKNDARGQHAALQRRCCSMLRAVRWLEGRRNVNMFRPWRRGHKIIVEEDVFDQELLRTVAAAAGPAHSVPGDTISLRDWLTFYLGAVDEISRNIDEKGPKERI